MPVRVFRRDTLQPIRGFHLNVGKQGLLRMRSDKLNDELIVLLWIQVHAEFDTFNIADTCRGKISLKHVGLAVVKLEKMPRISYLPSGDQISMRLPLPLLDFVSRRSRGDFGQSLDPIYMNQLDLFCSQLVATQRLAPEDIRLLTVSVTGVQKIFSVDINDSKMEIF